MARHPPHVSITRSLPWLAVLTTWTACSEPTELNVAPCYERYRTIPLEEMTNTGFAPLDAIGWYEASFTDAQGRVRRVEAELASPVNGWVRDIVREPTFGYELTPACDIRVGVEAELRLSTADGWFSESFYGAAVRSGVQDAWLVRAIKPLGTLSGTWPEAREGELNDRACEPVNLGFSLFLDGGDSGGRIVEQSPGRSDEDDPCFREILAWELPTP